LKAAWVATGGSAAVFEKDWPKLREMLRREVIQDEVTTRPRPRPRLRSRSRH
jgi:hypothetical protein